MKSDPVRRLAGYNVARIVYSGCYEYVFVCTTTFGQLQVSTPKPSLVLPPTLPPPAKTFDNHGHCGLHNNRAASCDKSCPEESWGSIAAEKKEEILISWAAPHSVSLQLLVGFYLSFCRSDTQIRTQCSLVRIKQLFRC